MEIGKTYLTIPHDNAPIAIKEITEQEFDDLRAKSSKLNEYEYYQGRLREIELNKIEFFRKKEYYTDLLIESDNCEINYDFKNEAYIDFNRCLINFSASIKSLIDYCENKIKNVFGENSAKNKEFLTFKSEIYDSNFEYKFILKIRDYAIHVAYPIEYAHFSRIKINGNKPEYWYEVNLVFSKSKLLRNHNLYKKIKADLSEYDEYFLVSPFLIKVFPQVKKILVKFITIAKGDFISIAKEIAILSDSYSQDKLSITKPRIEEYTIYYDSIIIPVNTAKKLILLLED